MIICWTFSALWAKETARKREREEATKVAGWQGTPGQNNMNTFNIMRSGSTPYMDYTIKFSPLNVKNIVLFHLNTWVVFYEIRAAVLPQLHQPERQHHSD